MRRLLALACAAFRAALIGAALAAPASAQTPVTYVSDGAALFSFEAPDDWALRTGFEAPAASMPEGETPAPRILSLMPEEPAGLMWVGLWSPKRLGDVEEAADWIETLNLGLLEEARLERSRLETINGMRVKVYSGSGRAGELPVLFDLALAQLAPGRVAAALFIGEVAAREAHGPALAQVLRSMEAAR